MIGAVVIGRNEGARLRQCLSSVIGRCSPVVYVDSGSTDGSVDTARELGAELVELDPRLPFTAARARNEGVRLLRELRPDVTFVQFLDGDTELLDGWLEEGRESLERDGRLAAVSGGLRERDPERSVYSLLCELEWRGPAGLIDACGGNALMRLAAFEDVGGFDPRIAAGEEPELCLRLRERGYRIERLDAEMAIHDAGMTRFVQWWRRSVRTGRGAAEGWWMHRRSEERFMARRVRSALLWGAGLPLAALALAPVTGGGSVVALALTLLVQWARIYRAARRQGNTDNEALCYATFTLLGKPAEALGTVQYFMGRVGGARVSARTRNPRSATY